MPPPPQQFAPPFGYMPNQPMHPYHVNNVLISLTCCVFFHKRMTFYSKYHFFGLQNQMQHGSCMNCSQQQLWNPHMSGEPQWNAKNLNGSNMSLNIPPFYPQQFDMNGTTWMNNGSYRKPDYPYHFGMIPNGKQFHI